jgi:hypothetical protein
MEDQSIIHTKFLLYFFKNMSCLKINYQKSEVLVIGGSEEEQERVAGMLNCNVGSLPIKYLGVWVNDRHMPSHRGTGTTPRSSFRDRSSGAGTTGRNRSHKVKTASKTSSPFLVRRSSIRRSGNSGD